MKMLQLTLVSVCLVVLFFCLPVYRMWLTGNLLNSSTLITTQMRHMDLAERMENRFGKSYSMYKKIANILNQRSTQNIVILLPPNELLRKQNVKDFLTVEPAEFYYFTGYEAVYATSPHAKRANWAVVTDGHGAVLKKIAYRQQRDSLLNEYSKYNYSQ